MIEEGDFVVVTSPARHGTVKIGMYGVVIATQRQDGQRFVRVALDQFRGREIWIETGNLEIASDPVEQLGEEYFT